MTGGPVMPTIGASMQLLRPGEHTKAHRHTGSFIYQVAKGGGYSIIEGRRYDWTERDIFCVPSWAMHEHVNLSSNDDACLFCFNDLPVMRALSLYREEALGQRRSSDADLTRFRTTIFHPTPRPAGTPVSTRLEYSGVPMRLVTFRAHPPPPAVLARWPTAM